MAQSKIIIVKGISILSLINEDNIEEGISINRRLFLKEIKEVYNWYLKELKLSNNLNFRQRTFKKNGLYNQLKLKPIRWTYQELTINQLLFYLDFCLF